MAQSPEELLREAQALLGAQRPAEARAAFEQLVALQPSNASLRHGLALALKATGEREAAGNAFAAALALQPGYWEAAFNLGVMLEEDRDAALAERAYRMALAAKPDAVRALGNLGNLLRRAGKLRDAEEPLRRAVALAPSEPAALGNLALLCIDAGQLEEARRLAERAASLAPNEPAWWEAAGTAARLMSDAEGAVPLLERAAARVPDDAGVRFELALALEACADDARAAAQLAAARKLAPAWEKLRWADALHLPAIVEDDGHAQAAIASFDAGLARLESDLRLDSDSAIAGALEAALAFVPFNLHYLPGDHLERQARYARLVARVARAAVPAPSIARATGKIRVGFVSSYMRTHVVARFFASLMTGLDPARFERWAWHTGGTGDAWTQEITRGVEHFDDTRTHVHDLAAAIGAAGLDVLIYLDVGLDPLQGVLAALRLAPVQAALYGHPVSTGLDTLDDFLSGELLEPAGAEQHYRENLVRLPGLGARPRAPATPGDGHWMRALRPESRPLAVCAQNLQKLPPAFDATLARIAAGSRARLVFFDRGPGLTRRFSERLSRALARAGVDAREHVRFAPARAYPDYLAGLAEADLVLDSPGFSGGATSLDALGVGAAVLAFEGDRARSRQTSAMLRLAGVEELIVRDADAYAARAQALLGDAGERNALRQRIVAGAPRIFGDGRPLAAFAGYLERRSLGIRGTTPN
jgi:protein O-GlcNAc transferase